MITKFHLPTSEVTGNPVGNVANLLQRLSAIDLELLHRSSGTGTGSLTRPQRFLPDEVETILRILIKVNEIAVE